MDEELIWKILETLDKFYDRNPTGVMSKYELAGIFHKPVKEIQGILIHLKEKDWINSYQNIEGEWVQKINAKGREALKSYKANSVPNLNEGHLFSSRFGYVSEILNQCIPELDELGKPLSDIEKMIFPEGSISINYNSLNSIHDKIKNLLKHGFPDDKEKGERFFEEYTIFCNSNNRGKTNFLTRSDEEVIFKNRVRWIRRKTKEFLDEIEIMTKIQQSEKNESFEYQSDYFDEEDLLDTESMSSKEDPDIFVSHRFVKSDKKLAKILSDNLKNNNLIPYLANRRKEYGKFLSEKIKENIKTSKCLIAIITKFSKNAPSVNQEIGYALGVETPVIILAEEDEAPGVLVKGVETELFKRKDFDKHWKVVLQHIPESKSKRLSFEEKNLLTQNVYDSCYNQIMNIFEKREFFTRVENPWKNISHSWKLRTEPEMKNLFEEYTENSDTWNKIFETLDKNSIHLDKTITDILKPVFRDSGLLNERDEIILDQNHNMQVIDWWRKFRFVLFDEDLSDYHHLYDRLAEFAKLTPDEHVVWLEDFYRETNLLRELFWEIPKIKRAFDSKISFSDLKVQHKILKESIEKLKLALVEKLTP